MMTIEIECAKCDVCFPVDDFDETQAVQDTTCPECGADLEISEFDPVTKDYTIEDVTGKTPTLGTAELEQDEEEEEPEDFGLVVSEEDEEDEEDEEG